MRNYFACYYRYTEMRDPRIDVTPDTGHWTDRDSIPCTAYAPILRVSAPNAKEARKVARYLLDKPARTGA